MTPEALPARLLSRARSGLPPGARVLRILRATRERAMYNFHYEIDVELEAPSKPQMVVRIALCAQEWQAQSVPDTVRYQLLWRAVAVGRRAAARSRGAREAEGAARRFRFSRNFTYGGHFPCELRPPPWT